LLIAGEMYCQEILQKEGKKGSLFNRYLAQKKITSKMDAALNEAADFKINLLKERIETYSQKVKEYGLRDWVVRKNSTSFIKLLAEILFMVILLPIPVYGVVMNYIAYKIPSLFSGKVKDAVFLSSFNYAISLFLYPVYYLLALLFICFVFNGLLIKLLLLASMTVSGIFAFYYYIHFLKLRGKLRLLWLKMTKKSFYQRLISDRQEIIELIKAILKM
jgi:hypothetical protein